MGSSARPEREQMTGSVDPRARVHVCDGCARVCVSVCGRGRGGHPRRGGHSPQALNSTCSRETVHRVCHLSQVAPGDA